MCFVAIIVQSRLANFDRSLEEAAMDLGCPPGRTFFRNHVAPDHAGRDCGIPAGVLAVS